MDCFAVLAQTVQGTNQTERAVTEPGIVPITEIWEQIMNLNWLEAITFISFGAVCLLYGWRIFSVLVVISFGLLGLVAGIVVTDKFVDANTLWGGVAGLVIMAIIAMPLMRYAVSILGAVAGGMLTAGIWYACKLPETYIWAGALVGVVAGGMISFIIFKVAVMLFSSLGGSMLMVTGLLALLYLYPQTEEQIRDLVFNHKWFLPAMLLVPTGVGMLVQNKFVKNSKNWEL